MTRASTELARAATPLVGHTTDFDALIERVGEARLVLLGEASHGTHEFYDARATITRRLIAECGFSAVAVEADWPDAHRVNEYVRGESDDVTALEALQDFRRFPQWMWRNRDVLAFTEWLRQHNDTQPDAKAGFYGLDLYSLHASMQAVLAYLDSVDAGAAARARARYACFDNFGDEPQRYGYAASLGHAPSCEREALAQLLELQKARALPPLHDAPASRRGSARDRQFFAVENARLVSDAERYYRMMFTEGARSWNFRDRHMVETLGALSRHLSIAMDTGEPRIVVWAHNSHLGDARATDMARRGELNVGQLVREQWGDAAVSVGFTTYSGTVTAASDWDAPAERKRVVPARADSYEGLMHEVAVEANEQRFMLDCAKPVVRDALPPRLLERAIGVIYRPDTERQSHYFFANISAQFDLLLHFDETCAVTPLDDAHMPTVADDAPDTFPSAL